MAKNSEQMTIAAASAKPNDEKPGDTVIGGVRDEKIHVLKPGSMERLGCGLPNRALVFVQHEKQFDQVTCENCKRAIAKNRDEYVDASNRYKSQRAKVVDRAVLQALSDDDEVKKPVG